jgi:hypothetical protein
MSLQLLGRPFSLVGLNDVSDMRLDAKTWMVDTADNIFTFPRIPGQFFLPRDSGHGFTKNQPCFLSVDGDQIIALGLKKHTHSMDTDLDGGLMVEEFLDNIGNLGVYLGNTFNAADFVQDISGAGADVTEPASGVFRVEMDSGTASGGYANIRRPGVVIDFSKKSAFVARYELEGTIANYLLRIGLNSERVDASNDPTLPSYGIEACSGQTNWQCWSSDGTARSTTPTSYAVDSVVNVWMAQHYPADDQIIFTKNILFGSNQVTKESDIPVSGVSATRQFFSSGVKSTTASQAKQLRHYGAIVVANIGTAEWKWYNT